MSRGSFVSMLAATAIAIATPALCHAGDSSWLICKGIADQGTGADKTKAYVVASVLELRGENGRDLAVSLIFGDRVSRGRALGKNGEDFIGKVAPLKLSSIEGKNRVTFTGKGELKEDMTAFTLTGSLDEMYGDGDKPIMVPFAAKLKCELLDNMSINH